MRVLDDPIIAGLEWCCVDGTLSYRFRLTAGIYGQWRVAHPRANQPLEREVLFAVLREAHAHVS